MYSWSRLYKSKVQEVNVDLFCIADACARSVTTGPSSIKHSNAGLGVFIVRTFSEW